MRGPGEYSRAEMERRFSLGRAIHISERFARAPHLARTFQVNDQLSICHSREDEGILTLVAESLRLAYGFVRVWLGAETSIPIQLWLAADLLDLQYMTAARCPAGSAFSPGRRKGLAIIISQSPHTCPENQNRKRMTGILIHEISNHFIRDLCRAGDQTMQRREKRELPMWVEEGLCLHLETEFNPSLKTAFGKGPAGGRTAYSKRELWNDLSAVEQVSLAYSQAFHWVSGILEQTGKQGFLARLREARHHECRNAELPCGDDG